MPQQGQHHSNLSIWQQAENMQWMMKYPALTVMVFLRRDMGYRFLNPLHLLSMTGILAFISVSINSKNPHAKPEHLFIFAVLALFLGGCQRTKRWRELKRGIVQHSYYIGTSPFDFRWLPNFIRCNRKIARFIDPIFCLLIGLVCLPVSSMLGLWLIFAGASLRAYEHAVHRKELNRNLDMLDSIIVSQVHSRTVEKFEDQPSAPQAQGPTGIPTGLAPDIQKQIKRRNAN